MSKKPFAWRLVENFKQRMLIAPTLYTALHDVHKQYGTNPIYLDFMELQALFDPKDGTNNCPVFTLPTKYWTKQRVITVEEAAAAYEEEQKSIADKENLTSLKKALLAMSRFPEKGTVKEKLDAYIETAPYDVLPPSEISHIKVKLENNNTVVVYSTSHDFSDEYSLCPQN